MTEDVWAGEPEEILNAAIRLPHGRGIRLVFGSPDNAKSYRWRLYSMRQRERAAAEMAFEPGTPYWGKSPWESLSFIIDGASLWVGKLPTRVTKANLPLRATVTDAPAEGE